MRRTMLGFAALAAVLGSGLSVADTVPQWNDLYIGTLADSSSSGSELLTVSPAAGQLAEQGCPAADAYVVRDPAVMHSALAMLTAALAMGWRVWVQTSGACDTTGRPLVTSVQLGPN